MEETTTVLKTDVLGRVKIAKEHREALLDAFERAGISGKAFARHHGVNYQTFASWIQKRRKERGSYPGMGGGSTEPLKLTLAEVELPAPVPPCTHRRLQPLAEIVVGDGLALRVHEGIAMAFVAELVKTLRSC
jgi:hypothetical protein